MTWEQVAKELEPDTYVDWVDRFFVCPVCQEMILEADYPIIEDYICPICEWGMN